MKNDWINSADRLSDWSRAKVVVAGLGVSGFAAADGLLDLGAQVLVLDESESQTEKATLLEMLDAEVRIGPGATANLPEDVDLVITSPGWLPDTPLLLEAEARGIPIWGEPDLAWRMMHPDRVVPWLGVTGTNGKTTTVQMLTSILTAAGLVTATVGNIGRPIVEAVMDERHYDVFAVELSSFQLHTMNAVQLHSAAVLNFHADHLEWYRNIPNAIDLYAADKARIYHNVRHSCIYNVAEPVTEKMVFEADVIAGARAIGFTLGVPDISMLGVVDDLLVDRAFVEARRDSALEIAKISDITPAVSHNVENALAAAALARSFGVRASSVSQGLRNLKIAGHRIETVAKRKNVTWIDDSKATNPHAANASISQFNSIVWIAGGQAKGTNFDKLIQDHAHRFRAVILLGVDRQQIADTFLRHAPNIPCFMVDSADTSAMDEAVRKADKLAHSGDVVLLAPGCASKDMFTGYEHRGDYFQSAIKLLDQ